jgi:hypothetical protein
MVVPKYSPSHSGGRVKSIKSVRPAWTYTSKEKKLNLLSNSLEKYMFIHIHAYLNIHAILI